MAVLIKSRDVGVLSSLWFEMGADTEAGMLFERTSDPEEILKCLFCAYERWVGDIALGLTGDAGEGEGDSFLLSPTPAGESREERRGVASMEGLRAGASMDDRRGDRGVESIDGRRAEGEVSIDGLLLFVVGEGGGLGEFEEACKGR